MNRIVNNDAVYVEDGVEYHAETGNTCVGCAFWIPMKSTVNCPPRRCTHDKRADRTSVIWVRAQS